MRSMITEVLDTLLARHSKGSELSLDEIGEALGARAVTADEIAWLVDQLEKRGLHVGSPHETGAAASLGRVLTAARALRAATGRPPTVAELSTETSLSEGEIRRALLLARVLGR